jgi:ethanolamine utilization protein EutQ (cupin superfamily)
MKTISLKESQLIKLIEAEVAKVKKSDLKKDWDAERIVNAIKRDKNMYIKTDGGQFKQVDRKAGQKKTYFLTKKEADEANGLIKEINRLQSKLDSILK